MTDRSLKLISYTTQTLGKRRAGIEPHTRTSALGLGRGPCFNSIQKQEFPKRQAVMSSILIPLLPCAEERGAPLSSSIQHNPELSRSTWEPHALPTLSHTRLQAMWRPFPPQTGSNSSKANKRTTKEKKIEEDSRLPNSDTIFDRNMALDRITGTQIAAVSTKHSSVQEDPKDMSFTHYQILQASGHHYSIPYWANHSSLGKDQVLQPWPASGRAQEVSRASPTQPWECVTSKNVANR